MTRLPRTGDRGCDQRIHLTSTCVSSVQHDSSGIKKRARSSFATTQSITPICNIVPHSKELSLCRLEYRDDTGLLFRERSEMREQGWVWGGEDMRRSTCSNLSRLIESRFLIFCCCQQILENDVWRPSYS